MQELRDGKRQGYNDTDNLFGALNDFKKLYKIIKKQRKKFIKLMR